MTEPISCRTIGLTTKSRSSTRRYESGYAIGKRAIDLLLLLLIWAPLIVFFAIIVAICIKLQSWHEPVIFSQVRAGLGGREFKMYKFRSMVPNAEALKDQISHLNALEWPDFKIPNDPRVTRIGRFLRSTSLDEIPQFFNVLKGEMSLVGPRPTSILVADYQAWQLARLEVIPGITGLWQITGRGETNFDRRCQIDIDYIQRRNFRLDLKILLTTVGYVLRREGVH